VPQFDETDKNTFQVTLWADGHIDFVYDTELATSIEEAATGIAPGNGTGGVTAVDFAHAAAATGPGALAESFRDRDGLDTVAVARKFYATHPDDYQQLIVYTSRRLVPAGTFSFDLGGETRQLTAYELEGAHSDGRLFLPFLDATSGTETYGAGRYLDLEPDEDGTYAIDFNLAYHPSCVYAPQFSCPLTPAENRLPVRIEAGERLAEGAGAH